MNLRAVHHVNSASTYFQCSESGCGRTFSHMWSFKRHLEKEHDFGNTFDDPFEGPAPPADVQDVEMQNVWESKALTLLHILYLDSRSTYCVNNMLLRSE